MHPSILVRAFGLILAGTFLALTPAHGAGSLRVLFLGDNGHHRPADRFKQLQPVLEPRGISLTYTESLADLEPATLARYDALIVYANHTRISPDQEKALLEYVAEGHGFVPLHCASYCFLNSPKYVELVGAQFKSHGLGTFKDTIVDSGHPVMKGLQPIESFDESYVHSQHNERRTVLAERRDERGNEPYTWVRQHGKGRVFYTAWGHDQRTWGHVGFQALVENGIRWAAAASEPELKLRPDRPPLRYTNSPAAIPNYLAGRSWGTQGDAMRQMQLPLDPAESARHVSTLAEFEAQLWAAEPDILKPIAMTWDERGRLWIAETVDYPNELQAAGQGRDRIKICEDTNGDGRADKFTVFADQLSIPTTLVLANGGLIVIESGHTLFLKDTNGDGKADERRELFKGWGVGDTHATASNLRFGPDNWIWGVVGYSGFDGTVGGRRVRFGQGVFRFKPDGSALEFIKSSNNNTWGLGLSEEGIVFGSTANNNASWYMPIANRYYEAVAGWSASRMETIADSQDFFPIREHVRQVDAHGRYTAGAGHALYTARNYPREYWNRIALVTEPTGGLIGKFRIEARGADFIAHNERSFLAGSDEWFAPIMAEVGPDGQFWFLDWYNYIIQHNPTPAGFRTGKGNAYETPLRDKTHGRIYRVAWMQAQPAPKLNLADATSAALVDVLANDNLLWRMHAQRLLVERGDRSVVPALVKLTRSDALDGIGLNPAAMHALWTLQGILGGGTDQGAGTELALAAREALRHRSAGVRRAALQTLPRSAESQEAILAGKLLDDPDAQVRLAAFLALSEMPPNDAAGAAVLAALQQDGIARDRWLPHAATAAAAQHDAGFLKAVLASIAPPPGAETARPKPANLMANASFENEQNGRPLEWRTATHSGRGDLRIGAAGHNGARSAEIRSTAGGDISWSQRVKVEPNTSYRLSAWVRTEEVKGAMGALLNVHELQGAQTIRTKPVTGTMDWTRVETEFNSGDLRELTINCLFGGWGRSTGAAWFDDVELVATGGGNVLPGALGTAVRIVTGHYAQRAPVETVVPTLFALRGASPTLAVPLLDGLARNWPLDKKPLLTTDDEARLVALMKSLPDEGRSSLLELAGRWGKGSLFAAELAAVSKALRTQVVNEQLPAEQRVEAAMRLLTIDDSADSVGATLGAISTLSAPRLSAGLLGAVAESRRPETGPALVAAFSRFTPTSRRVAIAALLRRAEWSEALLAAVEQGTLQRGDLAAEHWSQLRNSPDKGIAAKAARLNQATGASSADMEAVIQKLLPVASQKGDAARGKELFTMQCAVCHTFEGQGAKIGPDLTGIGARAKSDFIVDIIDPNRSVEANYRLWNVSTKGGDAFSGRLDTETATTVEILDSAGQKHTIQRRDIAEMSASNLSIMPAGFEQLPGGDLAALLEYLASSTHK